MFEEKKEYLNQYKIQGIKINRLKEMALECPKNQEIYILKINSAQKLRDEIESKISAMKDEVLSELLFQKYVFGLPLEEVGYIINYSKRQTERLHRKALEEFTI